MAAGHETRIFTDEDAGGEPRRVAEGAAVAACPLVARAMGLANVRDRERWARYWCWDTFEGGKRRANARP
jgi:hypothetical protein